MLLQLIGGFRKVGMPRKNPYEPVEPVPQQGRRWWAVCMLLGLVVTLA